MPTKFHAEDPEDSSVCTCGYIYPKVRRGGHPILRAESREVTATRAAAGMPFARIAEEMGPSLHLVRRVVHG